MSSHVFHNLASHTERLGTSGRRGLKCKEERKVAPGLWVGVSFLLRKDSDLSRVAHVRQGGKGAVRGTVGVPGGAGGT